MRCAQQQHLKCKNRAILSRIKALQSHFKAFHTHFVYTVKNVFSFKKCVKIKLSIMDKSQHMHFVAKIKPSATKVPDYSSNGYKKFV